MAVFAAVELMGAEVDLCGVGVKAGAARRRTVALAIALRALLRYRPLPPISEPPVTGDGVCTLRLPTFDLTTPLGRVKTYTDYLWRDHAYLRLGFQNAHWVSPDLIRTNQPWPFQLARWRRLGVKTVINLRGGGYPTSFYLLEREACERLGLTLVDFAVSSREAPTCAQVEGAKGLFDSVAYPAVMHCKSGADRAGIMSVLYAHFRLGLPLRDALARELSIKTLHVRQGKTGVLDYTFERYFAEGEPEGLSFLDWVRLPTYDPKALKEDFQAGMWGSLLTETLLRRE